MKVNGNSVGARQVLAYVDCTNANDCSATAVLDPVAYASPGQFYNTNNNLIGPSTNPFALEPNVAVAYNPDHQGQWAQTCPATGVRFRRRRSRAASTGTSGTCAPEERSIRTAADHHLQRPSPMDLALPRKGN